MKGVIDVTVEDVKSRLKALGYEAGDGDIIAIEFAIEKMLWEIKNECNINLIPDGLHNAAVDMTCGNFLRAKKESGQLPDFNADDAVKSIREGDTQITYAVEDGASAIDRLITFLSDAGKSQLVTYRRLVW